MSEISSNDDPERADPQPEDQSEDLAEEEARATEPPEAAVLAALYKCRSILESAHDGSVILPLREIVNVGITAGELARVGQDRALLLSALGAMIDGELSGVPGDEEGSLGPAGPQLRPMPTGTMGEAAQWVAWCVTNRSDRFLNLLFAILENADEVITNPLTGGRMTRSLSREVRERLTGYPPEVYVGLIGEVVGADLRVFSDRVALDGSRHHARDAQRFSDHRSAESVAAYDDQSPAEVDRRLRRDELAQEGAWLAFARRTGGTGDPGTHNPRRLEAAALIFHRCLLDRGRCDMLEYLELFLVDLPSGPEQPDWAGHAELADRGESPAPADAAAASLGDGHRRSSGKPSWDPTTTHQDAPERTASPLPRGYVVDAILHAPTGACIQQRAQLCNSWTGPWRGPAQGTLVVADAWKHATDLSGYWQHPWSDGSRWEGTAPREWNEQHSIGTAVRYWPVRDSDRAIDTVTRSGAWTLGTDPVVKLVGVSGGVSLWHLEVLGPTASSITETE